MRYSPDDLWPVVGSHDILLVIITSSLSLISGWYVVCIYLDTEYVQPRWRQLPLAHYPNKVEAVSLEISDNTDNTSNFSCRKTSVSATTKLWAARVMGLGSLLLKAVTSSPLRGKLSSPRTLTWTYSWTLSVLKKNNWSEYQVLLGLPGSD